MQQALETFLNTIESTPSLLALDGALRYVFPALALVILLREVAAAVPARAGGLGVACRSHRRPHPRYALGEPDRAGKGL